MMRAWIAAALLCAAQDQPPGATPEVLQDLKAYRHKIVYETFKDGNWEIYLSNADGSGAKNLTSTPDVDEVYPKASPDGTKIVVVADEGKGEAKVRNLYVMNLDGSARKKIADNGREPCWSGDSKQVAYLPGEFDKFTYSDFATKGIRMYDVASEKTRDHPNNAKIHHLYTLNWTPDGKWFIATVHGGMGFKHGLLALAADGDAVVDLKLSGCRPDVSPDGKKLIWGHGDFAVGLAELDFSGPQPVAKLLRNIVESKDPIETYHCDWSPDMKYVSFTLGPKMKGKNLKGLLPEFPGVEAPGWNVCIADASQINRWAAITLDGKSNKESDWVFVPESGR
ncbi:MAG TPA: hypothetical protein VJB14_09635 [Planctomycetota bacterium]|nr:hypothetical protein [Planctomycetota bacterium]